MKNTLYAIGEALIDFIPDETGCGFGEVKSFSPKIGGAPANVLGAFAKLGGKAQLITQLGDDLFGHKIAENLKSFGIGTQNVKFTTDANTALAFVSLDKDGNRTFSFYRNPSADMLYSGEDLTEDVFGDCFALHFCSVSLGDFPMKEAHKRAIELANKSGAIISFDPNIRLPLWKDTNSLKSAINEFLPFADIIKVSDEETELITGSGNIDKACEKLLDYAKIVICTCGKNGAYAYTKNSKVGAEPTNVAAKDTTGAGDAFIGSFLYSLHKNSFDKERLETINKKQLGEFITASNNYCAKSVQRYGAIESYPDNL